jgi:hypothetical protein
MTLTSTDKAAPSSKTARAEAAGTCPDRLVRAVRAEVRRGLDWQQTADRVAGAPAPMPIGATTHRQH